MSLRNSRFFLRGDSESSGADDSSDDEIMSNESQSDQEDEEEETPVKAPVVSKRNKFLKKAYGGVSSSDSSSSSSSESDDDMVDSEADQKVSKKNRFLRTDAGSDSDSSSDGGKTKVIRSARDKRGDEMRQMIKNINNAKKIGDWVTVSNEYDKVAKHQSKSMDVFGAKKVPRFYIRALVHLEDSVKEAAGASKDSKKKMNALTAKALNSMKQKVKKFSKEFETEMAAFRQNPVEEEDSHTEDEELEIAPRASDVSKPAKKTVTISVEEEKGFSTVGKGGKVETAASTEMPSEALFKKLKELIDLRGKKSTDKLSVITQLRALLENAKTSYQKCRVILALIPAQFDYTSTTVGYMTIDLWKSTVGDFTQLMTIAEKCKNLIIKDGVDEPENDAGLDKACTDGETVEVLGNIASFVDRLDEEFRKSLQSIDPNTSEYIDRLKDETLLYTLLIRSQAYYAEKSDATDLANSMLIMRRVEHIYFKPDSVIKMLEDSIKKATPRFAPYCYEEPVNHMCVELYKTKDDRMRTRALLSHVYHHALHNRYNQARDMLLMSHLQENAQHTDVETQILYNRAMVQIGLCAFRCGLVKEAASALADIASSGRVKELLAQGLQTRFSGDRSAEQEKLEKSRQVPFHMHINLDLLECVHLTCSMLLEVPNMALHSHDSKRRVISKPFRRMLDYNERQSFTGPPENIRDHIMGAARNMAVGEWEMSRDLILSMKIWDMLPNPAPVKSMLTKKIQEESLRTYVFRYGTYSESMSVSGLSGMFGLESGEVASLLCKMIADRELEDATLDETSAFLLLDRKCKGVGSSGRLEYLAGLYAEKLGGFIDNNDKLLEAKSVSILGVQREHHGHNEQRGRGRRFVRNYNGRS